MSHFLCFTDLSLASRSSCRDESAGGDKRESSQLPTTWFAREENKKSSFLLLQPYALFAGGEHKSSGSNSLSVQQSAGTAANENEETDDNAVDANDHNDPQGGDSNSDQMICCDAGVGATSSCMSNEAKETLLVANATITSCASDSDSGSKPTKLTSCAQEVFLFGGFELITNVKTVEVYAIRPNASKKAESGDETYLTTCKGIPARDVPPLATTALYVNGTSPNVGANESEEQDTFYKFIFVSPGGPKPAERVRLKFVRRKTSSTNGSIIVQTLKVKGRLSDSIPAPNTSNPQSMPQPSLPMGAANFNQGIPINNKNGNMGGIASMMAMIGGNSAMSMPPMAMQMNAQQQQLGQMRQMMQPPNQQYFQQQQQQQQSSHQQEKNQAELISSIAGIGLYMKSSEERTMKKFETMLTNMEDKIMKRLDNLAKRIDTIEKCVHDESKLGVDSPTIV